MDKPRSKPPLSTPNASKTKPPSTSGHKPKPSNPNPNPNPNPAPNRPSSSSSSASPPRAANPDPNEPSHPQIPDNPQPKASPSPGLLGHRPPPPPPHHHHMRPPPPQPAAMARQSRFDVIFQSIRAQLPRPKHYGLETLDRRTIAISDGTIRHYFALPPPEVWDTPPLLPLPQQKPLSLPPLLPLPHVNKWELIAKRKREDEVNAGSSSGSKKGRTGEDASKVKKEAPAPVVSEADLKKAFLKMAKRIYEDGTQKRLLMSDGKVPGLKCIVCGL